MNFISHINSILYLFNKDSNINPAHISLYMALFREWNISRFSGEFKIHRKDMMKKGKIGSNTTYYRCITDLHHLGYIKYIPSKNPHGGSVIKMSRYRFFKVSKSKEMSDHHISKTEHYSSVSVPVEDQHISKTELYSSDSVPVTIYKQENDKNRRPLNEFEVINFFKENGQIPIQAIKFFKFYEAKNWTTSNNEFIKDWRSVAETYILNETKKIKNKKSYYFTDHLQTTKDKNYDEPL